MSKTDLRVIKTKRAIQQAGLTLILKKPINKITITELAQTALINKGTFYLHYADIYALYDELLATAANEAIQQSTAYPLLFQDNQAFVREFLFADSPALQPTQLALLKPENLRFAPDFPKVLLNSFKQAIYQVGKLPQNRENDLRLTFLLNGMISLLVNPTLIDRNDPDCINFTVQFISRNIEETFLEFYGK
ncbi:TetR/AcrR family transcriptional regulator [Lactiplantibacillus pingfangensis]|uniref:TetR/AcrR family transcriptional regulator n=1 Tax=Lactiplantibacillus pingfangensis TaxID=2559915 RepID=UPI0010FA58A9|nr:TetR/AcrR family transcriptional regulator [Lactiplantibacillus pingfangensis]